MYYIILCAEDAVTGAAGDSPDLLDKQKDMFITAKSTCVHFYPEHENKPPVVVLFICYNCANISQSVCCSADKVHKKFGKDGFEKSLPYT